MVFLAIVSDTCVLSYALLMVPRGTEGAGKD